MEILDLLLSKSCNVHYVKRYYKFINYCKEQNKNLIDEYTETHHILPKAEDLFPEYENLKEYPWNYIELTFKQHLIAHVILWKSYKGSQSMALECMLGNFNSETNSLLSHRKIPTKTKLQFLDKVKKDANLRRSVVQQGYATYKDSSDNKYFLHYSDPKIQELNLVGNNTGLLHSEDTKLKMSESKLKYRMVELFFLDNSVNVRLMSPEYVEYLNQGWVVGLTGEDRTYRDGLKYEKVSASMENRYAYLYPNGDYYGYINIDDPVIKEIGLIQKPKTDKQMEQYESISRMGAEYNKNKCAYNNGEIERNYTPGTEPEGWVKGGLTRKPYEIVVTQNGSTMWNDGVKNYRIKDGEFPKEGWIRGIITKKRDKPVHNKNKVKIVNIKDKTDYRFIVLDEHYELPEGYKFCNNKNISRLKKSI
jgi:hypothetical protein